MRGERHDMVPPDEHQPGVRVSDRDREHLVDALSEHAAAGRLTLAELEARIDAAHAARTRGEVAALTADLPTSDRGDDAEDAQGRLARARRIDLSHPLVAFIAVNLALVAVWALSGGGYFWPAWPLLGWGLGLAKSGSCARRRTASSLARRSPAAPWGTRSS